MSVYPASHSLSSIVSLCLLISTAGTAMADLHFSDAVSDESCEVLAILEGEGFLRAAECPVIFGDDEDHLANQRERRMLLSSVYPSPAGMVIVHTSDWDEPHMLDFAHLSLTATLRHPGCPPLAIVELHLGDDQLVCDDGLYLIRRDHRIGRHGAVLAILDELVLLEYQGELRYLLSTQAESPDWRMVFRSAFDIILPTSGQVTTSSGSGRPAGRQTPQQRRQEQLRRQQQRRRQQRRGR